MKDLVLAVYRRDCYAGVTILKLEKVLYCEEIPEKYKSNDYEIKLMWLADYNAKEQ